MNPWIDLLNNPPKVTREELDKAREIKKLIQPGKRYNLPLKYKEERCTQ